MILSRRASVFKIVIKNFSTNVNVVSSLARKIEIPKISLHELMWRSLDKWPNKTAITCFETQRSYTFQELYKKSTSITKFLKEKIKLRKSETVAVILPNVPEFPIALLGAIQAGLKVTTCNPNYTADEIRKQLQNAKPKLVFTLRDLLPTVRQAVSLISDDNIPIVELTDKDGFSEKVISFKEISSGEGCEPVDVNTDEIVLLPYSSGTTGLPKGVQLNHSNVVANLCQVTTPEFAYIRTHEDVVPAFLPFFHIYGLVIILMHSLMLGAKVIAMPKFHPDSFVKMLKNYKPPVLYSVPPVVIMANNNPNIKTEDLACIRILVSGAAPLGPSDVERFQSKTRNKVNLVQAYGMTETSPVTLLQTNFLENGIKIGGSGLLVPNTDAKILPVDGSSSTGLGPNQPGELAIKGPQVMQGYFNNPQANEEIFLEDGWLKTGDIAYYDEDGHFYIKERLKELIKVKGFQVAPAELEEVLRNHPGVADVAVIGVTHPDHGEVPKAFVVPKSGQKVDDASLKEFVAARVVKYKQLVGGVTFIDAIPKNPSGKILRRELRKL